VQSDNLHTRPIRKFILKYGGNILKSKIVITKTDLKKLFFENDTGIAFKTTYIKSNEEQTEIYNPVMFEILHTIQENNLGNERDVA